MNDLKLKGRMCQLWLELGFWYTRVINLPQFMLNLQLGFSFFFPNRFYSCVCEVIHYHDFYVHFWISLSIWE